MTHGIETVSMDHHHRRLTMKPSSNAKSIAHRRLWSLQNITGAQQWRKVGPLHAAVTGSNEESKKIQQEITDNKTMIPLMEHSKDSQSSVVVTNNQYEQTTNNGVETLFDDEQHYKRNGIHRKAAKGLKRIITHFSLSDVNSLTETPDLSSNPPPRQQRYYRYQGQVPVHAQGEDDLNSDDSSSLDTLSTVSDMHDIQAPFTLNQVMTPIEANTTPNANQQHHRRSISQPAMLMMNDFSSLAERSLPPLPPTSEKAGNRINAMEEYANFKAMMNQVQMEQKLRQAVNWLGKPFHRLLSSPMLSTMANSLSPVGSVSPLIIQANRQKISTLPSSPSMRVDQLSLSSSSSSSLVVDATTAATLLARCDTNSVEYGNSLYDSIASQEDQEHLPWVRESSLANGTALDQQFRFAKKKVLRCRVIQITNMASSKEYQYELFVQLNDITQASQTGTLKKIAKGISAASPKESFSFEVDSPFTLSFTLCAKPTSGGFSKMKSFISKMDLAHYLQEQEEQAPPVTESQQSHQQLSTTMPVVGSTCLLSGNRFEAFSGKGLSRYTLTRPISQKHQSDQHHRQYLNHRHQQDMDLELMVAFQLEDAISPSHTYMSGLWTGELDFEAALASCQQGDYLTFYVRSKQFPTWTRYWITLAHGQLYLRQLSYEHKDPIESIPLSQLQSVCKPWEDVQEQVYFGRKHGIVLKFKKDNVRMDQVNLEEGEKLDGFMYLFADSPKKAALWRTVLSAYATADYATPSSSINGRYLW